LGGGFWYKAASFAGEHSPQVSVELFSHRCKVKSMSERPEEPSQAPDAESLLPIDEHVEEGMTRKVARSGIVASIFCPTCSPRRTFLPGSIPSSIP